MGRALIAMFLLIIGGFFVVIALNDSGAQVSAVLKGQKTSSTSAA